MERGVKLRVLKKQMISLLQSFGIERGEASVESEMILEHVCGMNRSQQLVCSDIPITDKQTEIVERHIFRRRERMPIQYCLGMAEFGGYKFKMRRGVFIPRTDTEILVEKALEIARKFDDRQVVRILEVGVGSGAISISLLKKNKKIHVTGTDISEEAISLTLENVREHELVTRMSIKKEGLWWLLEGKFDIIVCNPPYIPLNEKESLEPEVVEYEPHEALFGRDADGLRFYRKLSTTAEKLFDLTGGYIAVEVGDRQAQDVAKIFKDSGWKSVGIDKDVNGIPRVVSGFWGK